MMVKDSNPLVKCYWKPGQLVLDICVTQLSPNLIKKVQLDTSQC